MARRRCVLGVCLAVGLAGCAAMDLGTGNDGPRQVWSAELPAADAAVRTVTLTLEPDGRAVLATRFAGKPDDLAPLEGMWLRDGPLLQVRFPTPGSAYTADRMIWVVNGDLLEPREWDRERWGAEGLPLVRQR